MEIVTSRQCSWGVCCFICFCKDGVSEKHLYARGPCDTGPVRLSSLALVVV
jgi:hypothetical protein